MPTPFEQPQGAVSGVWEDREYVSRYAVQLTGLSLYLNGVLTDSETPVVADIVRTENGVPASVDRSTDHPGVGFYDLQLLTADTSIPDVYDIVWHFSLAGVPQTTRTFIQVGDSAPAYDDLDPDMKAVVDSVWWRFADSFDSAYGGPHLQQYFQSHFGRQRIAQLLAVAMGRLNTIAQPHQTYNPYEPGKFPVAQWGALLEHALYVEVIKHLIRSYVEIPDWPGLNLTHAQRRDYMDRWRIVLDGEQTDLEKEMEVFKIASMGLGRPHVLIAGGVFGRYGPVRAVGSFATRPRMYARFY